MLNKGPIVKELLNQMVSMIRRMAVDLFLISQSLFNRLMNKVAVLERSGLYMDFNHIAFL